MVRRTTYNDSLLKVLNGPYADFADNGYIAKEGKYQNNKKEGSWYVFDDTAHAIIEFKYHNDSLLSTIDLDSLTKEKKKIAEDTTDQVEAFYPGGDKSFSEFIRTNIEVPDRTASVSKGGTTRVQFVIDTNGKVTEIKIVKSVEFAFDEESLKVVGLSKKWIPASDKGKKLKAYRIVPISLKFE